jgi:hypothetical protein
MTLPFKKIAGEEEAGENALSTSTSASASDPRATKESELPFGTGIDARTHGQDPR